MTIRLPADSATIDVAELSEEIRRWGRDLGFQDVGFSGIDLTADERHLLHWLKQGYHGEMAYMERHGLKRSRPARLVPGTLTVISLRMDYLSERSTPCEALLQDGTRAFISNYAVGRDYHKVLRGRLRRLAGRIADAVEGSSYRVFVDSAPVLEKALARNAGLGWIGKHSNLINRERGSWFFLGEIFTDLPLVPMHAKPINHCGTCDACLRACPTAAIVAPYQVDARRCISYLTIELRGSIPLELRPLIGNRVFGCDDCQLVCPWNRFARLSVERDFKARTHLDSPSLLDLFSWSESEFEMFTEGSPIRRIGHVRWLRNLAVALGNGPYSPGIIRALKRRMTHDSALVREHVHWALTRHGECMR